MFYLFDLSYLLYLFDFFDWFDLFYLFDLNHLFIFFSNNFIYLSILSNSFFINLVVYLFIFSFTILVGILSCLTLMFCIQHRLKIVFAPIMFKSCCDFFNCHSEYVLLLQSVKQQCWIKFIDFILLLVIISFFNLIISKIQKWWCTMQVIAEVICFILFILIPKC